MIDATTAAEVRGAWGNRMTAKAATSVLIHLGMVVAFWAQGELFLAANGPTFDEAVHLAAGHSYWATGDFRLNVEDPPLPKLLWALPGLIDGSAPFRPDAGQWDRGEEWLIGHEFLYGEPGRVERLLRPARRVNLLFGVGVVVLVGVWARRLWSSDCAGAVASALAAFDPTLVGISGVLSSDAALTLFTLLSAYCLWEYAGGRDRRWLVATGVALGLTLGSKFSAVATVAGLLAGVAGFVLAGGSFDPAGGTLAARLRSCLTPGVRITILALVTLACLYFVIRFPDWGRGLKQQLVRGATGDPHFYFLGEVSVKPSPWYFVVALAVKLPLGTLALVACAAAWAVVSRRTLSNRWTLVALPPAVFLLAATASGVNLGVRVVLPVVPFLWLLAGGFAAPGASAARRQLFASAAVFAVAISALYNLPTPLSYFNELAPTPGTRLRLLGDSNLDWGQGLPAIKPWMREENVSCLYLSAYGTCPPRVYGIDHVPLPGFGALEAAAPRPLPAGMEKVYVAVFGTNLQGVYLADPHTYNFLRSRTPHAVLAGSVWVYDVTGDADALQRLEALAAQCRPTVTPPARP